VPVMVVAVLTACASMITLAPAAHANWLTDLLGWSSAATNTPAAGTTSTTSPPNWLTCLFGYCPATTTTTAPATTTTQATTTTTGATTTTTAAPVNGDCGTVPNPAGGTWRCTFDDEFNGTTLDRTKWSPQISSTNSFDKTTECYVDSPNNISEGGGALTLTVRKEAAPFNCNGLHQASYTSGMVSTNPALGPGFSQTNGRWEIRAKFLGAKATGLQESLWMWPVTQTGSWPYSGEIDIAEVFGLHPDRAIPFIHYDNGFDSSNTNNYCMIDDISQYHTYALDWTPASLRISYDGTVCIDDHWMPFLPPYGRHPFDAPFYLILTQALGVAPNTFDPATTPLPASTVVDYVRVWG
jgi:beta-glucanase (GH16 family)